MYICPECQKQLKTKKSLASHLANVHGKKPGGSSEPSAEVQTLTIEKPGGPKAEGGFHCVDCGATLTKGQTPCPNCGVALEWSE